MPEAVFSHTDVSEVGRGWLDRLKRDAQASPRGRARLCLHADHDDVVQEMVIAFRRGSLVRPHRHVGKCESLHVIEGELAVLLFDEAGHLDRRIDLSGNPDDDKAFMYRLSTPAWHTVVPMTEYVVVHEVTQGPFDAHDDAFATWAPAEGPALARFVEAALAEATGDG